MVQKNHTGPYLPRTGLIYGRCVCTSIASALCIDSLTPHLTTLRPGNNNCSFVVSSIALQHAARPNRLVCLAVRLHIIRNARIENVGKSQSCMFSTADGNGDLAWETSLDQWQPSGDAERLQATQMRDSVSENAGNASNRRVALLDVPLPSWLSPPRAAVVIPAAAIAPSPA